MGIVDETVGVHGERRRCCRRSSGLSGMGGIPYTVRCRSVASLRPMRRGTSKGQPRWHARERSTHPLRCQVSLVVGVIASVVALSACSADNTYLPALLADPMASYEADGIVMIDAWQRAEGRDPFFRKRTPAEVGRVYRISDQGQADQVLEEAATFAQANGWRMQRDMTVPTLFVGAKSMEPGDGRLGISLAASDPLHDPDGPQVLSIHLDFGPVRFDETTTTSVVEGG